MKTRLRALPPVKAWVRGLEYWSRGKDFTISVLYTPSCKQYRIRIDWLKFKLNNKTITIPLTHAYVKGPKGASEFIFWSTGEKVPSKLLRRK